MIPYGIIYSTFVDQTCKLSLCGYLYIKGYAVEKSLCILKLEMFEFYFSRKFTF